MVRKLMVLMAVVALTVSTVSASANVFDITYAGSLSTEPGYAGYLTDGTGWIPSTLTWNVSRYASNSNVWQYEYELTVPPGPSGGNISHMILEVTDDDYYDNFSLGSPDMFNLQRYDETLGWVDWDPAPTIEAGSHVTETGSSNPGMPADVYAVKFEDPDPDESNDGWGEWSSLQWRFDAYRMPVWGDFYAKDGEDTKYVYNAGFADPDPTDPARGGSINSHILRPNGRTPELPPSALLGVTMLPLGLAYIRGRKRRDD